MFPFTKTLHNQLSVEVHLASAVPSGMTGSVHLDWFDPDNPQGSTKSPTTEGPGTRDNHGNMLLGKSVFIYGGSNSGTLTATITPAHAGDNYIVAAHPNEGIVDEYRFYTVADAVATGTGIAAWDKIGKTLLHPNPLTTTTSPGSSPVGYSFLDPQHQSQKLTVWRTLNVECDVMAYYPGTTNTGTPITPPSPADYLGGMVTEQLARACVLPKVYSPAVNNLPPTGHNPINEEDKLNMLVNGRDLSASYNNKNFWTVRIIMSSAMQNLADTSVTTITTGGTLPGFNTIVLFYEAMIYGISSTSNQSIAIQRTLLHEIAHCLIDSQEKSDGIRMQTTSTFFVFLNRYQEFLVEDLRDIQYYSRAND